MDLIRRWTRMVRDMLGEAERVQGDRLVRDLRATAIHPRRRLLK